MDALHSLIHSLTPNETQLVKKFISSFASREGEENIQSLKLFDYLLNRKEIPDEEICCIHIYGTPQKEETFSVLKHRLKEKILDMLLTDISCDKKQELDEADYMAIKIKKKSAQFQQLYYSKKRTPLLYTLLDEIIFIAKEYEQYSNLVEHLRLKKALVSWKKGKQAFEKINKDMQRAAKCGMLYNKAEHYYYELGMMLEYSGKRDKKKELQWLQKAIAEIETENQNIKSPHVNYSLKFLELEYYQLKNNYVKARSVCLELLDVVCNNKSVFRRQRVGVVYDNLSRCEFYLKQYEQAARDAREAQKYFNLNSENYCIALEQEFYAVFALEQYDDAITLADKMISSATRKELGEFRYSKYKYLLANALFKQRRFTEALNILSEKREIAKDKAGWEIGARVLNIMTLVEMLSMDKASLAVSNLKRFFSRIGKQSPVSVRDKKIFNLLIQAERKGFMFTMLNGTSEESISILSSKDSSIEWEPFTHEVIPFHEWFASKMVKGKRLMFNVKQPLSINH